MKLEIAASTQHFFICTENSPEKLRAVRRLLAVEPLPLVDDVEVGELAEVGVGLPAQPGRLAALEKADVVQANRQLQSALGRIRGEAGRNREGQIGGLYEGPNWGEFGAAQARKELRVRQGAHTWEGGRRGGGLWQRLSVGSENRGGGERPISSERESWWAADEGNRSPSGKAASRPPLPQGLTHHGAPSDSFYLRLLPTLLLQLSSRLV